MKEVAADKKVLLYLTALGFVNTSISAIGLKESAKKSSKYSFNPEDVEKAIRKADQAWENIQLEMELNGISMKKLKRTF